MTLRRDTSSNYGDDEPEAVPPIASLLPPLNQEALMPAEDRGSGHSILLEQDQYRTTASARARSCGWRAYHKSRPR